MELKVNGEQLDISAETVSDLLAGLEIDPRRVAVELNLEIVPKNEYASRGLNAGDRIEIVHFVGGG